MHYFLDVLRMTYLLHSLYIRHTWIDCDREDKISKLDFGHRTIRNQILTI